MNRSLSTDPQPTPGSIDGCKKYTLRNVLARRIYLRNPSRSEADSPITGSACNLARTLISTIGLPIICSSIVEEFSGTSRQRTPVILN
ncbi:hypothetical protein Isop_1933 [Isosphaera pallida ATCC 43644]|uniref:Uncharacterized protein n=1 Tax=Isosphaera pallida (strain ATCC 43644 / DSM 9630 / IS1B) TaxID=575540 RepID=E8R2L3_ISOPI|nr:hypothetical protein Isop_1933 [Isosphaera pallida ATCC 43644]